MGNANELSTECAETKVDDGIAFIEGASPLTRLHYFDGKFLKADALSQEQAYHRTRVQLSNLAGGWGVVNGLGIDLVGNELAVSGGLAITPAGNFVMSVSGAKASLDELIKVAEKAPPEGNADFQPCVTDQGKVKGGSTTASGLQIYEITVGPIDALCGNEPVFGKLCESACVSDSRHPWWREGMVLRLRPISLKLPSSTTPLTTTHRRNLIASAYFALEPGSTRDLLSRAGLQGDGWCGTASLYGRDEIVLGLLYRDGSSAHIDSWSARRERMDSQARGYWQGRMAMRPWNVYLAQILQFQCQLSAVLDDKAGTVKPTDECDDLRKALDKARKEIAAFQKKYASSSKKLVERFGVTKLSKADQQWAIDEVKGASAEFFELSDSLSKLEVGSGALPANRLLFNSGFQQLPPAGYLPIEPHRADVSEQLQRWFGEGVRLHLRAARADVLPHLLEEAQHMERISLTRGLDNPNDLEDVEVFIPDGQVQALADAGQGTWWQTTSRIPLETLLDMLEEEGPNDKPADPAKVAARLQRMLEAGEWDGLTRTEARDDGTYGLTTVLSIDLGTREMATGINMSQDLRDQLLAQMQERMHATRTSDGTAEAAAAAPAPAARAPGAPQNLPQDPSHVAEAAVRESEAEIKEASKQIYVERMDVANYAAADLATDPFTLAVGAETQIKLEMVSLRVRDKERRTHQIRATGQATLMQRDTVNGMTRIVLSLDIQATSVEVDDKGQRETKPHHAVVRIGLVRKGDGATGLLRVDDFRFNPLTPCIETEWDDAPRHATVSMVGVIAQTEPMKESFKEGNFELPQLDEARAELINAAALSAMPGSGTAIGARALNAITTLADALDDAGFLARARARLFPAAQSGGHRIQAQHDWVMFRRLRPNFCSDVVPVPLPAPAVEAFQVWHLKVATLDEAQMIAAALSKGDDSLLQKLKPKRVGILRYQDDSSAPEEGSSRVLAMWQQAQPGNMVAFGRVWETTPEAGQGWQNHFRLRDMLKGIATLTTPPASGSGAIAALPKAPGPLADGQMDGGMLVVTLDKQPDKPQDPLTPEGVKTAHQVLLMPMTEAKELVALLRRSADQGWAQVQLRMKQALAGAFVGAERSVQFENGVLVKSDAETLIKDQDAMIKFQTPGGGMTETDFLCLRVDASVVDDAARNTQQHDAIKALLKARDYDTAGPNTIKVSAKDLGGGAQVASIVFIYANNIL